MLLRSLAILPAPTTRPPVTRRSWPTPLAFLTRPQGSQALAANTTGATNTADGYQALLSNTTGVGNIALGVQAGSSVTTASNVICIGTHGAQRGQQLLHRQHSRGSNPEPQRHTSRASTLPASSARPVLRSGSRKRLSRWTKPANPSWRLSR